MSAVQQASIDVPDAPEVQYVLRLGDTCLIQAQRLAEWSGHAPVIEEDIALTNMALDLIGQARALLTRAGQLEAEHGGTAHDEDQLAYLRAERGFRNLTLVELPRGDFAVTVLRNFLLSTFLGHLWERLAASSDAELAAIAAKAVKEARYHRQHAGDWVLRLGGGTEESHRRLQVALDQLWLYVPEIFEVDAVDEAAAGQGLGPRWADLEADWSAEVTPVLVEAGLQVPKSRAFRSTGKRGVHSEHMGYILAEMQHLQRSHPGGVW